MSTPRRPSPPNARSRWAATPTWTSSSAAGTPGLPAWLPDNSADAPQGSVIAHAHTRTHTQLRIRTRAYLHTCAPAYSHTYI